MILGCHLSIAGGLYKALEKAAALQMDALALFVRNQVQWQVAPLPEAEVERFVSTRRRLGIGPVVAHGSYLVNLAGPREVRAKSIAAMVADLERCGRLGIEYLVFHPGSHCDERAGAALVADALNRILDDCPQKTPMILLETTAGQGHCLGRRFEQLRAIRDGLEQAHRVGACLDTCHVFAAGYDLRTSEGYRAMWRQFDQILGRETLGAIHVNDSKRELGSRVDRHEHIGRGCIGLEGFAHLVNDRRLARTPMILETPKGLGPRGRDWDRINAQTLRGLLRQ